jgi:hypothetical protein
MREAKTGLYFVSIEGIMVAVAYGRVNTNLGLKLRSGVDDQQPGARLIPRLSRAIS